MITCKYPYHYMSGGSYACPGCGRTKPTTFEKLAGKVQRILSIAQDQVEALTQMMGW